ncbi:HmuY family protein [Hyalangium rubrum]|uniref:HmuY family protein n=1 Tax=Hyalangium rubrum TaxID=3103134 RepID=A0ABU5HFE9_9BACT|nr:HmuY family protein [Hyalangium sp. s54d21]MDY7231877.1 HmuY family protein [Hyalangium sp. s54d21]
MRVPSSRSLPLLPCLLLAGWMAACGPDLLPDPGEPPDNEDPGEQVPQDPNVKHVDHGDGTFTTTVDATSSEVWIGLDLDQGRQADAAQDMKWDVAFQRFHIRTRGGVNGGGGVQVALLTGVDFAQVQQAPATGYVTDAEDGDDENTQPDTAFEAGENWYSYDPRTHLLTPRSQVYVLRTDEGAFFKIQIVSYYDAVGTPAMMQVRWGRVQPS